MDEQIRASITLFRFCRTNMLKIAKVSPSRCSCDLRLEEFSVMNDRYKTSDRFTGFKEYLKQFHES